MQRVSPKYHRRRRMTNLVARFTEISLSWKNENFLNETVPNDKVTQPPAHDNKEATAKATAIADILKRSGIDHPPMPLTVVAEYGIASCGESATPQVPI